MGSDSGGYGGGETGTGGSGGGCGGFTRTFYNTNGLGIFQTKSESFRSGGTYHFEVIIRIVAGVHLQFKLIFTVGYWPVAQIQILTSFSILASNRASPEADTIK